MNFRRWLLLVLLGLVILGPLLAPYDAYATDAALTFQPPGPDHPLGTDALGRDMLSRLLAGGQQTVLRALAATALAAALGITGGALMALGPRLGAALLRMLATALLAVPQLVWSLALLTLLGSGTSALILAIGLPLAPLMLSVSRSAFRRADQLPHVTGARAIGAGHIRIVMLHLLPATLPTIANYTSILFTYAILNAAGLAFLGFTTPGDPEWGAMLAEARLTLRASPWPAIFTGVVITALVWAALALAREPAPSGRDKRTFFSVGE